MSCGIKRHNITEESAAIIPSEKDSALSNVIKRRKTICESTSNEKDLVLCFLWNKSKVTAITYFQSKIFAMYKISFVFVTISF